MEFKRTQRQHFFIVLNFVLLSWLWYSFFTSESLLEKVIGVLCGVWAAVIAFNYLRAKNLGRLDDDGLTLERPFRTVSFKWNALQWASMGDERRALVFAYRHQSDVKDRYVGCGRKILTPDAIDAIVAAVNAARPDLPSGPPEAATNGVTT
ncbi:PH (Pleckstrin Homology) domain-containing protein [Yoonia maricola]|uniref:PH (Pleckstrin Homology) domain-containing protein n=1 Tax=Yoonia maricola TaxID=420999 RepID=A0A2M8WK26_9RHOB|nr:PH domain-containing protein [Yoonia maricola]PJI91246.1 PH (Pleckstrin Homology) domain-containing protein [Yoonia maricola]